MVYHTGHLDSDASADASGRTRRVQANALAAASKGMVDLVQRRVAPGVREYVAIKRRVPDPRPTLFRKLTNGEEKRNLRRDRDVVAEAEAALAVEVSR